MPHRDPRERKSYRRHYYQTQQKAKPRGRPVLEDRRVLVAIRVKASLIGRVQEMLAEGIALGTHRFKTTSQLVEELLYWGMTTLRGKSEAIDITLQHLDAARAIDTITYYRKDAQASFSRFQTEINELLGIKAYEQAHQYFWATAIEVRRLDGNIWCDWWLDQAKASFPKLAARPPKGMSLSDTPDVKRRRQALSLIKTNTQAHAQGHV